MSDTDNTSNGSGDNTPVYKNPVAISVLAVLLGGSGVGVGALKGGGTDQDLAARVAVLESELDEVKEKEKTFYEDNKNALDKELETCYTNLRNAEKDLSETKDNYLECRLKRVE